jgi:hypothetical protein
MKPPSPHLMLASTFSLICAGVGNATPIATASTDLTLETLMEVQLQDQLLLQAALPWNVTDSVAYTYSYDTDTKAFSLATQLGQSVGGEPFTFSTTAQYNASLDTWSWSGTGVAGNTLFQVTGDGGLNLFTGATGNIVTDDGKKQVKGKYHDDGGNEYDATAEVTIDKTDTGEKSSGTGKATDKDGKVVKSGKVEDYQSLFNGKERPWEINFVGDAGNAPGLQPFVIGVDNIIGGSSFQGSFVQSSATPEPSTVGFGVLGFSLIGLGLASSRKQSSA